VRLNDGAGVLPVHTSRASDHYHHHSTLLGLLAHQKKKSITGEILLLAKSRIPLTLSPPVVKTPYLSQCQRSNAL
jgi:hypothetical protein